MYSEKRKSDINSKPFCLETIHINGPANNMQNFHWHEYMEISYIRSGAGTYYIEDKVYSVQKGDVVLINNAEHHRVTYDENNPLFETVIHFYPDLIWSKEDSLYEFNRLKECLYYGSQFINKHEQYPDIQQEVCDCITRIEQECMAEHPFYEVVVKVQLLMLLTVLVRSGTMLKDHPSKFRNTQLEVLLEYIHNNLKNDLSLSTTAKQFYINATYLSSFFKEKMGIGYYNYVVQQRIEDAKKMLERTDFSVIRVAYECGFNSSGSFYNAFKRVVGISPQAYRKKIINEEKNNKNKEQ